MLGIFDAIVAYSFYLKTQTSFSFENISDNYVVKTIDKKDPYLNINKEEVKSLIKYFEYKQKLFL